MCWRRSALGSRTPGLILSTAILQNGIDVLTYTLTSGLPTFPNVLSAKPSAGLAPPSIDVLLPHTNWANPPRRPPGRGSTPYADWLIAVFDRWYGAPRQETRIRLFEEVMQLLLGGSSRSEQVGLSPVAVAVVESDGAIEQVDSLKSGYSGACATSLNVRSDTFDAALDHPGAAAPAGQLRLPL